MERHNRTLHAFAAFLHKKTVIVSLFMVTVFLGSYSWTVSVHSLDTRDLKNAQPNTDIVWEHIRDIMPADTTDCNSLLTGPKKPNYTREYQEKYTIFNNMFQNVLKGEKRFEGHVGELMGQWHLYFALAQMDFVSNICEIGFNGGHSAFQFLSAKPSNKVYSFDLGQYPYTRKMAQYFKAEYKDRFTIVYGDSKLTVPLFRQLRPEVLCDLLVIDGGHSYDVAKADLKNMMGLANPGHHLLVFDDYPSHMYNYMEVLGKAWNEAKRGGTVAAIFECMFKPENQRGFSVGHYVISK